MEKNNTSSARMIQSFNYGKLTKGEQIGTENRCAKYLDIFTYRMILTVTYISHTYHQIYININQSAIKLK